MRNIFITLAIALAVIGFIVMAAVESEQIRAAWTEAGYEPVLRVNHSETKRYLKEIGCEVTGPSRFAKESATGQIVIVFGSPGDYDVCKLPQGELLMLSEKERQLEDDDDALDAAIYSAIGTY